MNKTLLTKLLIVSCSLSLTSAATLNVGPHATFTAPCAAIHAAAAGDTILVDAAGNYNGDVCVWKKDNLTVRGINGRPHIDASGASAEGKAIWVIRANNATVDNIEFSGAHVSAHNGAGIRLELANLTVANSYFHDNDEGILTAREGIGKILIEYSEFGYNGFGDGLSHNIYINHADSFTLQYSYSHHANIGHLVKSRAKINYILYNRLTDEAGGAASYELDLPSGGSSYVIGNVIEQSAASPNNTLLSYLEEAGNVRNSVNPGQDLYVVSNTFVNDQSAGTFVNIDPSVTVPAIVMNNVFAGPGTLATQAAAVLSHNLSGVDPLFVNPAAYDYRLTAASGAIAAAGASLAPVSEYVHASCSAARTNLADIGAFAFAGTPLPVQCSSTQATLPSPHIGLSLKGSTVQAGNTLAGTVTLSAPAPSSGALVSFSVSSNAAGNPRTLLIPAGQTTAAVIIPTNWIAAPSPVLITATSAGAAASATFTVTPAPANLLSVTHTSPALYTFAVNFSGPPPAGGATVSLSSSNPALAQAPLSVNVPPGVLSAAFNVPIGSVASPTPVTLTASYNGVQQSVAFDVVPTALAWVGAGATKGSVYMATAAPLGGTSVSLTSSNPAVLTVPPSVPVPAGGNVGVFAVTTKSVQTSQVVTVSATYAGVTKTTTVTVNPK